MIASSRVYQSSRSASVGERQSTHGQQGMALTQLAVALDVLVKSRVPLIFGTTAALPQTCKAGSRPQQRPSLAALRRVQPQTLRTA